MGNAKTLNRRVRHACVEEANLLCCLYCQDKRAKGEEDKIPEDGLLGDQNGTSSQGEEGHHVISGFAVLPALDVSGTT